MSPSSKMLVKCETKSNRVKGVSFHPQLSWVLAALHNGVIQLWDYRFCILLEKFEGEHEGGPVRGVHFHPLNQPLFVSGGDDYKIKVWNYKSKRCIFTLQGHLDYIRTVFFHHEAPWVLSASDDQTVRIWNWQSRGCLAVLTGHNHYVMSAQFHPSQDMVCSASLDQTIRVWDISGLRKLSGNSIGGGSARSSEGGSDMFGTYDAVVKHVLEGHERGVNWATFHPTLPLLVSGADDRLIKLWRMSESKCWEVDTLKGHFSNVSSVVFHPHQDLIISNSEDRTIRVWDCTKRSQIHTFRRENDRFWVIGTHPSENLCAVGHDGGMVIFKLDRERPLAMVDRMYLYTVRGAEKSLVVEPLADATQQNPNMQNQMPPTQALCQLRRPLNSMRSGFRHLEVNQLCPAEACAVLITYSMENGSYDLCIGSEPPKSGYGLGAAFVTRNRFAVLEHNGQIGLYNFQNQLSKKFDNPIASGTSIDAIFPGGLNRVILKAKREQSGEEKTYLFDTVSRKIVNEVLVAGGGCRYVVWSPNHEYCALFSKHILVLVDKNFNLKHSVHENIRLKSGAWDEKSNVFVYSTLSHVKYCLLNGDRGIIHSLTHPIYIQYVHRQVLYYIDRVQHQVHRKRLNCTEYLFKCALQNKNLDDVKMWIKNGRLCGNVIIGYLKRKGYPEVALHFVDDPQTRFNLSLEYGHVSEAMKSAQALNDPVAWQRLGTEASRQGSSEILEMCFQKTKNLDALSFHYLITGNRAKLERMLSIAEKRQDGMRRFNSALMLGNIEERVKVLAESGQVALAYLTAKTYGLTDKVELLSEGVGDMKGGIDKWLGKIKSKVLIPPLPMTHNLPANSQSLNWALLQETEQLFSEAADMSHVPDHVPQEYEAINAATPGYVDATDGAFRGDLDLDDGGNLGEAWGGGDDDLDLPDASPESINGASGELNFLDANGGVVNASNSKTGLNQQVARLQPGESMQQALLNRRKMCVDYVIAGRFDEALEYLKRRIGLRNPEPLLPYFKEVYLGSQCFLPGFPNAPSVPLMLQQEGADQAGEPRLLYSAETLGDLRKDGFAKVQSGQFDLALASFQKIIHCLLLTTVTSLHNEEEEEELKGLLQTSMNYILVLSMQLSKKDTQDPVRSVELVNLMTCVSGVEAAHQFLFLRQAMTTTYKAENFIDAAAFATRILSKNVGSAAAGGYIEKTLQQAKAVLRASEEKGTNKLSLSFDAASLSGSNQNLRICAGSLSVIADGEPAEKCSYCGATFKRHFTRKTCTVCKVGEVGKQVMGMEWRKKF